MEIELDNVSLTIAKSNILNGVSAKFFEGSVTAVLGANGSGKSSLLKCIAGIIPCDGTIKIPTDKFRKIAYVPQRPAIPIGMTVAEFVLLGRTEYNNWYFGETALDKDKCYQAICSLSLSKLAGRFVETLSGGEMQRAVLARAVAQEASLLVLDEPTSALDIASQVEVISYLSELQSVYQLTVIVALHDLNLAINYAQSAVLLKDGRVLGSGDTLKIMNSEQLSEAYNSQIEVTSLIDGNKMVLVKYNL